ncbi:MAG: DUF2088 domain-containing protein [Calditrichaeota bacterium]|nr:DUF2088 domain-containing protein [Calditrichota bacterium]
MQLGKGKKEAPLEKTEIVEIFSSAASSGDFEGKKILVIVPDTTRSAPMNELFPIFFDSVNRLVRKIDVMIALGTHPEMPEDQILRHLGIPEADRSTNYADVRFFNHQWKNKDDLASIGAISEDEMEEISRGLLREKVEVTINKKIFDYDVLVIIGPTFPHEVVGFSGGNKYFFPGISGKEMIDSFHWLGALITNPVINGTKYTPVREVIDRAAAMIPREKRCFSLVVKNHRVHGIYFGAPEEAFSAAADLSRELNIVFKKQPFQKVLSCAPEMYSDLWTAGKCMYKIEPVVADGGELIIYAPHIKQVSQTHGAEIEKIGYHVRDYFVKQWEKFRHVGGGVLAHSTHVRGIGKFKKGKELPRIQVTLATQIPEEICRKINLGYRDPKTINVEEWVNREDEGILYVPEAGEILYRLENDPFRH